MPTVKESLEQILRDLRGGDIEASTITTHDGLVIASNPPAGMPREVFAAMVATMHKAAETATAELKKGATERIIAEFNDGGIIITSIKPEALLAVIAKSKDDYDLIFDKMDAAAEKIKKALS